jgi:hypothetical protein
MPFIAKRPDIKLQGLELHAQSVRDILERESREIRLSGSWAQTGELRTLDLNDIIPVQTGIGKGLQFFAWLGRHLVAKGIGISVKL